MSESILRRDLNSCTCAPEFFYLGGGVYSIHPRIVFALLWWLKFIVTAETTVEPPSKGHFGTNINSGHSSFIEGCPYSEV